MLLLYLAAVLGLLPVATDAAPVKNNHVGAELITEAASVQPGHAIDVGLRLRPDPGWHTYWKNPGDAGLPPKIEWNLPPGFSAGPIQWPTPQRIVQEGIVTYGYESEVLLITTIQVPAQIKKTQVTISAKVDWLACEKICVPGHADLTLTLPVKAEAPRRDPQWISIFAETEIQLPVHESIWQIKAVTEDGNIRLLLTTTVAKAVTLTGVNFFADSPEQIDSAAPQVFDSAHHTLLLKRPPSAPPIDKISGLLVSDQGWNIYMDGKHRGWEISAPLEKIKALSAVPTVTTPPAHAIPPANPAIAPGTLAIFAFAFLGGLILNLMPCVLPVLSIKVLGLVKHAGEERRSALQQMLAFTMGVLVSFWALAGVLLALRSAGQQLGWGFQMQSPVFVTFLCALFFLFALNLLGVFEIGASLVGIDAATAQRGGLWGSFGTGALATLSATPCTAPFMGSAVGFAVNASPAFALATFTFLGLGMAAPYLVLGIFPELLRFVPKPGRWMESFKQFLGFLLLGTVIFLLWVFGQETSSDAQSLLLVGLLIMGMGAWIYGRWSGLTGSLAKQWSGRALGIKLVLVGFGWGLWVAETGVAPSPTAMLHIKGGSEEVNVWEPFSPERIAELRAQGKPVFVDFTAAWCVNCKVNEAIALNRKEVMKAFKDKGIVLMRADWTKYDKTITEALTGFGRDGVPLYVLYGRDPDQKPEVLPAVITPKIVLDAIAKVE